MSKTNKIKPTYFYNPFIIKLKKPDIDEPPDGPSKTSPKKSSNKLFKTKTAQKPDRRIRLAFLYNVRHNKPDPKSKKSFHDLDFDEQKTINQIIKHLKACNFEVIPIEANEEAYLKLYKNKHKIDIAFNYSEGLYGKNRECHIPAMLEMLQIPYVGSSSLTSSIVFNKVIAKEILSNHKVPVAKHQVFKTHNEKLNSDLKFPLIVKPISQGSSSGITNDCVVKNSKELQNKLKFTIEMFDVPVMAEQYLNGREFSVGMIGNPPRILPIIEANHKLLPKQYNPIDSLEVKWFYEYEESAENYLICPAKLDKNLENKIKNICLKTWDVLDIKDWCRIDIRCDEKGRPHLLEINIPAGAVPPEIYTTSYLPLMGRAEGLNYDELLKFIINSSLQRHGTKRI